MALLWGIDLGGTKIEGAVIDEAIGPASPVCRIRVPTERENGYEHILSQMAALLNSMIAEVGFAPEIVGIGTPGAVDPESGELKNSNTVCLNGMPFRTDIAQALERKVVIANDANCFALAESIWGAARGERVVFGVILGTGVGGGLVVNGRVVEGRHGIAGEWGHLPLEDDGELCYCGRQGCVETVISGPALARYHQNRSGEKLSFEEIANRSDSFALEAVDRLHRSFGEAIAKVINIVDPDVIILGGGVGRTKNLAENAAAAAKAHVFNPDVRTKFVRPLHGDSAGVFGAALLCAQ